MRHKNKFISLFHSYLLPFHSQTFRAFPRKKIFQEASFTLQREHTVGSITYISTQVFIQQLYTYSLIPTLSNTFYVQPNNTLRSTIKFSRFWPCLPIYTTTKDFSHARSNGGFYIFMQEKGGMFATLLTTSGHNKKNSLIVRIHINIQHLQKEEIKVF